MSPATATLLAWAQLYGAPGGATSVQGAGEEEIGAGAGASASGVGGLAGPLRRRGKLRYVTVLAANDAPPAVTPGSPGNGAEAGLGAASGAAGAATSKLTAAGAPVLAAGAGLGATAAAASAAGAAPAGQRLHVWAQ